MAEFTSPKMYFSMKLSFPILNFFQVPTVTINKPNQTFITSPFSLELHQIVTNCAPNLAKFISCTFNLTKIPHLHQYLKIPNPHHIILQLHLKPLNTPKIITHFHLHLQTLNHHKVTLHLHLHLQTHKIILSLNLTQIPHLTSSLLYLLQLLYLNLHLSPFFILF